MKRSHLFPWLLPLALTFACGDDTTSASASDSQIGTGGDSAATDSGATDSTLSGGMDGSQSATGSASDSAGGSGGATDSATATVSGTGGTDSASASATESASDSDSAGSSSSDSDSDSTTGGTEPPVVPERPPGEEAGPCIPGDVRWCYTGAPPTYGVGECQPGLQYCVAVDLDIGEWGPCDDEQLPEMEVCDGADNDCDGETDEDLGATNCGLGPCNHNEPNCVDGLLNECDPDDGAVFEVCDEEDNDCDGDIDEGLGEEVVTCGLGVCEHTETACEGTTPECDPFEGQGMEVCDGLDNNCDGDVDEDVPDITCGLGVCEHTVPGCIGGVAQVCDPFEGQGTEVCDGEDNDCDGSTDEDLGNWTCGNLACQVTIPVCVLGVPQPEDSCVPIPGGEEICGDGIDNNCDGEAPDCAETFLVGADNTTRPVDVIWAIDSSGSMSEEMALVETEINDFAIALNAAGGTNRLHLIADRGTESFEICVAPPLGGVGCSDGARFFQYDTNGGTNGAEMIHSSNALGRTMQQQQYWDLNLQPGSHLAFIVTSDDDGDDPFWAAPNDSSEVDDCGNGLIADTTVSNLCQWNPPPPAPAADLYTSLAYDFSGRLGFISFMENFYAGLVPGDDWTYYSIIGETGTLVLNGADDVYEFNDCAASREDSEEYVKLSLYTGVQDQMISICDADWDLTGLADAIAASVPNDTYLLAGVPDGNCLQIDDTTITVLVNSIPVPAADWTYDAPTCTLSMVNDIPTVGDNVVIVYENL